MAKFLQPSMSGGELSPGLRGRTDMARYQVSLGRARNVITKPTGGVVKRPGTMFCGETKFPAGACRLIPFIYSTVQKYLVEVGAGYFRFWVDGQLVTAGSWPAVSITSAGVASITGHALVAGDSVTFSGFTTEALAPGRTYVVASVDGDLVTLVDYVHTGANGGPGTAFKVLEVATPYGDDEVPGIRFTQSADVLYLFHGRVRPKELRRYGPADFRLVDYEFRRGPFRAFNTDEAVVMAASSAVGQAMLTTNVDTFAAGDVGRLVYMEEKELRAIKPWASAEKNIPVGALRRADSKVYRVASIPTSRGSKGAPYWVTGAVRPVHDVGRAFDGPQDIKDDGVNSYAVGVEWEFLHNTFGIARITDVISGVAARATIIERMPTSVSGTAPLPENSWDFSGDGAVVEFDLDDATSTSEIDYTVMIDGVPVQSNPYYSGGGGVNGGGGGSPRPGPGGDVPLNLV